MNAELAKFFEKEGIKHEFTPAYTPQLNGVAERFNRTLLDRVRCLLLTCNVSKSFWPEAVRHSCVILNRVPHSTLGGKSPFELMTSAKPKLDMLRVFGCRAFVSRLPKPDKLDARSYLSVYLGYDPDQHCHRVWDGDKQQVVLSRDVTFDESEFPDLVWTEEQMSEAVSDMDSTSLSEQTELALTPTSSTEHESGTQDMNEEATAPPEQSSIGEGSQSSVDSEGGEPAGGDSDGGIVSQDENTNTPDEDPPQTTSSGSQRSRRPPQGIWSRYWTPGANQAVAMRHTSDATPQSYDEAVSSPSATQWTKAMNVEMQAMRDNQVFELVDLPPGKQALQSKWVYARKASSDKTLTKLKGRLVTKGFMQQRGVDFNATYAPVASLVTIRMVLALAVEWGIRPHQMDVKAAFLYGELEEEVYMNQPEGYVDLARPKAVCVG